MAHAEQVRDPKRGLGSPGVTMRRVLRLLANHHALAERLTFFLAFLPRSINQRMYLRYLQTRALNQISALKASQKVEFCVQDWRELRVRSFGQMADPMHADGALSGATRRLKFRAASMKRTLKTTHNNKVLVIGPLNQGALAESYARAFERLGMEVVRFDSDQR